MPLTQHIYLTYKIDTQHLNYTVKMLCFVTLEDLIMAYHKRVTSIVSSVIFS